MRGLEGYLRRAAIGGLVIAGSAVVGVGTAQWTMAEATTFYTYPVNRGAPLYARQRAVADDLWDRQEEMTPADAGTVDYAAAGSTATSVQPTYLSASGS
ncbi:hypothetical protein ACFSC3_14945 [Sphingomonas floccifaciens]|uniref:CAP domain-containing protein n=1 Tax=Sphingomonas floccifaciens TaxID=1844115 RepID=A0ABW4NHR6_9SPHN